ncbi:MAG: epoxyqueuosine reductase [Sporomusaceae bacterium]|nr:epoxyqueuosine reductase [Sporomusaceae bacterium]
MPDGNLTFLIREKALELGYESCGIIKVGAMAGLAARLEENAKLFPELKPFYTKVLAPYAEPQKAHPWAKSVVVCVNRYGKYKLPENIANIGKTFFFDDRIGEKAKIRDLFNDYLISLGLKTFANIHPGTTAYRWAAAACGLGIIRKNNFFYTQNGSWVTMSAWLIDEELELITTPQLKPCPENCTKCRDACQTKALQEPYAMNIHKCVCYLRTMATEEEAAAWRDKTGSWLYGCDDCQNACPMNKDTWSEEEEFPGLAEIIPHMSLEQIFEADDATLEQIVMPKFFYIPQENLWKWKANALIAMANNFEPKYEKYLRTARNSPNEKIQETATWACQQAGLEQ